MDRKFRFFKNALLLQFIPIILVGILILSNYREQKVLRIRDLHPYEFQYGYFLPLFFFVVCCVVSLFTLFPNPKDAPEDEVEITKLKRKQNFWKFAFFCNVFLLVIIGAFSAFILNKDPLVIDQPVSFYAIIFFRSLLVVVISLIVASFLLAVGIYWKLNKSLASFVLIFSFLILGVSVVFEFIFLVLFIENSQRYILTKAEKQNQASVEQVAEDYGDYEESEGDDGARDVATLLYESWNSLIKDWGFLDGKSDFYEIRKLVGSSLDDHIIENDHYYLVQFIDKLRNNPNELYSEFEVYKPVLFSAVSKETYKTANFDEIIDGLLLVYDDIGNENDKLIEIYRVMKAEDKNTQVLSEYFSKFVDYFSSTTIAKFNKLNITNNEYSAESDFIWFYSFWARRNHEGNKEEVAKILNEIKQHYNQSSEE
ncbi:hypothetical protein ACFFLS_00735 [Flavobacterium procerum]|uniref:ABC transporter permease n=1 Tax=Flavobacterium procerum TaxID=1455569 RepID=A0ABV6BJC2_9FLAO